MSYDRASEKFYLAIDRLASGPDTIQERLHTALGLIIGLRPEEIPDEVSDDFQNLVEQIRMQPPTGNARTTVFMNDEEASELATKIVSMFVRIEKAHHQGQLKT